MDTSPRKHFGDQLEQVLERVLFMGGLVEAAAQRALRAFHTRDRALAASVTRELEPEINRLEVELDRRVLDLLALQQPLAGDLRFLAAVLRIANDLERMGDLADNIARGLPRYLALPVAPLPVDLPLMAERANAMLRNALDALLRKRLDLARAVLAADDEVDRLRDDIFAALAALMARDPAQVERGLALLFIARNLERLADHATNIAEDVIFWLEGVDVRHHLAFAPADQ